MWTLIATAIVAFVFGAGLGHLLFERRRSSGASLLRPETAVGSTELVRELSAEELAISEARTAYRDGESTRRAAYQDHRESLAEAQTRIREAEAFARECGLAVALPWLWSRMDCWPNWYKMPERWTPPVELDHLSGESHKEVRWAWEGHDFAMIFEKWEAWGFERDSMQFGTVTLTAGAATVAAVVVKRDLSKEWDSWHFSAIDALQVGDWLTPFIRFYQAVRLAEEATRQERDTKYYADKAGRVDLGQG